MHAQIFHFTSDRFIGREQGVMNEWHGNSKSSIFDDVPLRHFLATVSIEATVCSPKEKTWLNTLPMR